MSGRATRTTGNIGFSTFRSTGLATATFGFIPAFERAGSFFSFPTGFPINDFLYSANC